jgi:hypothetical protein
VENEEAKKAQPGSEGFVGKKSFYVCYVVH